MNFIIKVLILLTTYRTLAVYLPSRRDFGRLSSSGNLDSRLFLGNWRGLWIVFERHSGIQCNSIRIFRCSLLACFGIVSEVCVDGAFLFRSSEGRQHGKYIQALNKGGYVSQSSRLPLYLHPHICGHPVTISA